MIPATNGFLEEDFEIVEEPGKTYKMATRTIGGFCDGLESVKQAIYKILNTERYQYVIYSWQYGIELVDLYGKPIDYVCAEVKRRIIDALLQDSRIEGVDSFSFGTSKKKEILVEFTVHTNAGDVGTETVVTV